MPCVSGYEQVMRSVHLIQPTRDAREQHALLFKALRVITKKRREFNEHFSDGIQVMNSRSLHNLNTVCFRLQTG